jgi:hypothetical protein
LQSSSGAKHVAIATPGVIDAASDADEVAPKVSESARYNTHKEKHGFVINLYMRRCILTVLAAPLQPGTSALIRDYLEATGHGGDDNHARGQFDLQVAY